MGTPRAAPSEPTDQRPGLYKPCRGEYALPHTLLQNSSRDALDPYSHLRREGRRFPSLRPLPTLQSAGWEGEVVTDSTLGTLQSAQCCFAHKLRQSKHRSFPAGLVNRVWGKSLLVRFLEATSSTFCFSSDALFRVFVKSALNLRPLGESCSISGLLIPSWGSCQTWGDRGTCTGHLGRSLDQLGLGELRPPQGTDRS